MVYKSILKIDSCQLSTYVLLTSCSGGQTGQHSPAGGGRGRLQGVGEQEAAWHKALPLWHTHSTHGDTLQVSPSTCTLPGTSPWHTMFDAAIMSVPAKPRAIQLHTMLSAGIIFWSDSCLQYYVHIHNFQPEIFRKG